MREKQIFRIDRFLGLNQADASQTELKMGEAARMVNWAVTPGRNITRRPGLVQAGESPAPVLGYWHGYLGTRDHLLTITSQKAEGGYLSALHDYIQQPDGTISAAGVFNIAVTEKSYENCLMFAFQNSVFAMLDGFVQEVSWDPVTGTVSLSSESAYIPTVITGSSPAGGGTALENLNLLTPLFKVEYHGDGTSVYHLPSITGSILYAEVDGVDYHEDSYTWDAAEKTLTFNAPPPEGVNNVIIACNMGQNDDFTAAKKKFAAMRFVEYYNGTTDSRIFFYGDGSNVTLYSGTPAKPAGSPTGGTRLYIPLMNEVALSDSAAPITGMARNYDKLIVFKSDSTYSLLYEPQTLADGKVIAGFGVHNISKKIGCSPTGQVQTVSNYPRTVYDGAIYEWKIASAYHRDERYASRISDRVQNALFACDDSRVVTCDDNTNAAYYIFLNDAKGTALVHFYGVDAWSMYELPVASVTGAFEWNGYVYIVSGNALYRLDKSSRFDIIGQEKLPVAAVWESGFMHFGADWRKKYSSEMWISTLPEVASRMTVTVHTDKRNGYTEKEVGSNIFGWYADMDYGNFSYTVSRSPKIRRTKLKVKKFAYYKLIFRVEKPGARATVLSADLAVQFAGPIK